MNKPKKKNMEQNKIKNGGRLSHLTSFERIAVYLLPFVIIVNLFSAFDIQPQYQGTVASQVTMGFDLFVVLIEVGLFFYFLSGRSLFNRNKKK